MKKIFSPLFILFLSVNVFAQSGSIEFTSSGTFTVPDNVYSVTMEVIGAGGSGGGNGTGGGGGGAYSSGVFAVTPGMVLNIFVGTGGTDETTGTTTVDGFLMATGGSNGVSVPNPEIGGGGNGGVPYGGNIANYFGGQGGGEDAQVWCSSLSRRPWRGYFLAMFQNTMVSGTFSSPSRLSRQAEGDTYWPKGM